MGFDAHPGRIEALRDEIALDRAGTALGECYQKKP